MNTHKLFFQVVIIFTVSSVSAETATIVTDSSLYQRPSMQAGVIRYLEAGTAVDINSRLGSWKKISINDDLSGWVRSYQVRTGDFTTIKQEQGSGGFISGLASLSRKVSGLFSNNNKKDYSFQPTATIGIRGLSEEQIKNAKADLNELKKMESFRSNKKNTRKYARKGNLKAIKIRHMPKSGAEE